MDSSVSFVGAVADIQIIRPADQENFGLNVTIVSPPGHNWRLLEAMGFLAGHDGFWKIDVYLSNPDLEDDEPT